MKSKVLERRVDDRHHVLVGRAFPQPGPGAIHGAADRALRAPPSSRSRRAGFEKQDDVAAAAVEPATSSKKPVPYCVNGPAVDRQQRGNSASSPGSKSAGRTIHASTS